MKKIKSVILFILFLTIFSCKSEQNCFVQEDEIGRTNNLELNSIAEKSLNTITKILSYENELKNIDEESSVAKIRTNEIYFNLEKGNEILYIKTIYWKDYFREEQLSYFYYEVPIKEIMIDNIKIEDSGLWQYADSSFFHIISKFNNEKAFRFKFVDFKSDPIEVDCTGTTSDINLLIRSENAQILKEALKNFIENYDK